MKQCAETDGTTVAVWVEQEPGSGGKEAAQQSVKDFAGFVVRTERVTGSKQIRAEPFAAQWQAGNVKLIRGKWNKQFLDECEMFPAGKHDDQVDAAAGAFAKVAKTEAVDVMACSIPNYWHDDQGGFHTGNRWDV